MNLVPCASYHSHYTGQASPRVPQQVTSHPSGKQQIASQRPQTDSHDKRVQKMRHAGHFTSRTWSEEEDKKLLDLRRKGLAWTAISRELPGRSYLACRLRFRNYLTPPHKWTGNGQLREAGCYDR